MIKDFRVSHFFLMSILICTGMLTAAGTVQASDILQGWSGDIFAGYTNTSGNTDKGTASLSVGALRKFDSSDLKLKGNLFYSESDNKMDEQKWDVSAKYSLDFSDQSSWFSFYQIRADHDYFSDIDYRITPSVGIGYHLAQTEDWTWDADAGLGYRITRYRINTAADDETAVASAHTFFKKAVLEKAFVSEDLTVTPGLESGSGVVATSETVFSNPLSEDLDLELKYIIDFDSEPADGKSKTDRQFVVGIKYKF